MFTQLSFSHVFVLVVFCFFLPIPSWMIPQNGTSLFAQFIGGSMREDEFGKYYSQYEYNPINVPGARRGSFLTGYSADEFFLFGGIGRPRDGTSSWGYLNDLWLFSLEKQMFMYIGGSDHMNKNSVCGPAGVLDHDASIGSRMYATGFTHPHSGEIYLGFGMGFTATESGRLNDLFKISIDNDDYSAAIAYLRGSNTTIEVISTVADATFHPGNNPGARERFRSLLIDEDNALFMFGLGNEASPGSGFINQIWKYRLSTNEYMLLYGELDINPTHYVAAKDVYSGLNVIPGRSDSLVALVNSDEIIIFGGQTRTTMGSTAVWKYSLSKNQVKLVYGEPGTGGYGYYETQGEYSSENRIGGRHKFGGRLVLGEELMVYGGEGYSIDGRGGSLNDVWAYSIEKNQWKFIRGSHGISNHSLILEDNSDGSWFGGRNEYGFVPINDTQFVIFGGLGMSANVHQTQLDELNDVWLFESTDVTCFGEFYYSSRACGEHGVCVGDNECDCGDTGRYGQMCSKFDCFNKPSSSNQSCSGHGVCEDVDKCLCDRSYYTHDCRLTSCQNVPSNSTKACFGHGKCLGPDFCSCDRGRFGEKCQYVEFYVEYWYVLWFIVPLSVAVFLTFFFCSCVLAYCVLRQTRKLKRYDAIEDIELVIQEQMVSKEDVVKLKFSRELFTIEMDDLKLLKLIGTGGSQCNIYLTKWKEDLAVFKLYKNPPIFCNTEEKGVSDSFAEFEKIIHRDIKPPNVLVTQYQVSKLADFGLSRSLCDTTPSGDMTMQVGTVGFVALIFCVITEKFIPYGVKVKNPDMRARADPQFRPEIIRAEFEECQWILKPMQMAWDHEASVRPPFTELTQIIGAELKEESRMSYEALLQENQSLKQMNAKMREDIERYRK